MTKSAYGEVSLTRDGHVAILEINRPPNNHVTVELMRDLADALSDIDTDGELRASVLASAGIVLVYTFMGGLTGAIYNEVLQFFLIVAGFAPLSILAVAKAGGWSGMAARLSEVMTHTWKHLGTASDNPMPSATPSDHRAIWSAGSSQSSASKLGRTMMKKPQSPTISHAASCWPVAAAWAMALRMLSTSAT